MKSENQTMSVTNQNQEVIQCLLTFSYSIGEINILQTVLLKFFSVFIFSMPSKVIIIVNQFMFLGINIFCALVKANSDPHLTAWAKMSLSRAQNTFMPNNINSIIIKILMYFSFFSLATSAPRD